MNYIKMELLEDDQLGCDGCGKLVEGVGIGTTIYLGLKTNGAEVDETLCEVCWRDEHLEEFDK